MRMPPNKKGWLDQIADDKATLTCDTPWDNMTGGDEQRFCDRCQKNVMNLSEMTASEAEARLWRAYRDSGEVPCVTFLLDDDGRMIVEPEPRAPLVSRGHARLLAVGLVAALPLAGCSQSRTTGGSQGRTTGAPQPPSSLSASQDNPPGSSAPTDPACSGHAVVPPPGSSAQPGGRLQLAGKPLPPKLPNGTCKCTPGDPLCACL